MRKRIVEQSIEANPHSEEEALDTESLAEVELTSEDAGHVFESALRMGGGGWRASRPGAQRIALRFDAPQHIGRLHLVFQETELERTQEFALRWSADTKSPMREILRQQYTFSPPTTTSEIEDYSFNLKDLVALELEIIPDIDGGSAYASIAELSLFKTGLSTEAGR